MPCNTSESLNNHQLKVSYYIIHMNSLDKKRNNIKGRSSVLDMERYGVYVKILNIGVL